MYIYTHIYTHQKNKEINHCENKNDMSSRLLIWPWFLLWWRDTDRALYKWKPSIRSPTTLSRRVWPQKGQGLVQNPVLHQNSARTDWWTNGISILYFSHVSFHSNIGLQNADSTHYSVSWPLEPIITNTLQNLASYVLILPPIISPKLSWNSGKARLLACSEKSKI